MSLIFSRDAMTCSTCKNFFGDRALKLSEVIELIEAISKLATIFHHLFNFSSYRALKNAHVQTRMIILINDFKIAGIGRPISFLTTVKVSKFYLFIFW